MKRFHPTSLSAACGLLTGSWMQAVVLLLPILASTPTAAQDRYQDQWNFGGSAEEDEARHESVLNPSARSERLVSDDLHRAPRASRSPIWFAPAGLALPAATPGSATYHDTLMSQPEGDSGAYSADSQTVSQDAWSIPGDPAVPAEPFVPAESPYPSMLPHGEFPESGYAALPAAPLNPEVVFSEGPVTDSRCDEWQVLPAGLLYHSYLAGEKEPRMQFVPLRNLKNDETYWDAVLGGRVGLLRYGTVGPVDPQGFQLDLEGAVYARVLPNEPSAALAASDYRAGILGTWRQNGTAYKLGYYHVSAHVGDEYLGLNPGFMRINYVRDSLIAGVVQDLSQDTRIYGEIGWAAGAQGGAEPLELQFGAEHTPLTALRPRGAPYAAINGHYRQEFGSNVGMNVVAGWNWLGPQTRHRLRIGLQYYTGPSLTYEFFDRQENLIGGGIWFDY